MASRRDTAPLVKAQVNGLVEAKGIEPSNLLTASCAGARNLWYLLSCHESQADGTAFISGDPCTESRGRAYGIMRIARGGGV